MIKQSSFIRRDTTTIGKSEGRAQTLDLDLTGRKANHCIFKKLQTTDLDLRINLSTRKKLRDHEYEVTVF